MIYTKQLFLKNQGTYKKKPRIIGAFQQFKYQLKRESIVEVNQPRVTTCQFSK